MRLVAGCVALLALSLVLVQALPASAAQYKPRAGETVDEKKGVALKEKAASLTAGDVTCTLTVSPDPVNNGQTFSYTVSYGGTGCVNGRIVETVRFYWTSSVPEFGEATIRKKMLFIDTGCLAASFENTLAPAALGINGKLNPQVEVRDWTGKLICTASTPMTVN